MIDPSFLLEEARAAKEAAEAAQKAAEEAWKAAEDAKSAAEAAAEESGENKEAAQNSRQADPIRMMVSASGCTCAGNRYFEMGILIANNIFAIRISICPFSFSEFIVLLL